MLHQKVTLRNGANHPRVFSLHVRVEKPFKRGMWKILVTYFTSNGEREQFH